MMSERKVLKSVNSFSYKLYDKVSGSWENRNGNVLISPSSVYATLAITLCGARDKTAQEMKKVMEITDEDNLHMVFGKIWNGIIKANSNSHISLEVANKLWLQEGMVIDNDFVAVLKGAYKAKVDCVDFLDKPESSRKIINNWISSKSRERIYEILDEDYLSSETKLLIISVLYFKGVWLSPFKSSKIERLPFQTPDGTSRDVELMYQKSDFGLIESSQFDCQVLVLRYKDSSLRMLIMLPNKFDGVYELEKKILEDGVDGENLSEWVSSEQQRVKVYLPKFNIFQKTDLLVSLKELGMKELFTSEIANLTGMSSDGGLHVNGFFHEVFIEVNEKGTEVVAASTSQNIIASGAKTPTFKADHSFCFCICDHDTEMVILWGRLYRP